MAERKKLGGGTGVQDLDFNNNVAFSAHQISYIILILSRCLTSSLVRVFTHTKFEKTNATITFGVTFIVQTVFVHNTLHGS